MWSGDGDLQEKSKVWLGVDLGTTSVKAVIIKENEEPVESVSKPTDAQVTSIIGREGFEQSPEKILQTVVDVVVPLLKQYNGQIKGIGITGQMHGIVLWRLKHHSSGEGSHLYPGLECSRLYTWQDQRCDQIFLSSLPVPRNSTPLCSGHGIATLYWLKRHGCDEEQDMIKNMSSCGTIMDLLAALLCGLDPCMTSEQLAASLGYLDLTSGSWDDCLKQDENFPHHLLPNIVPVGTKVGKTRPGLEHWPQDIPVYVAMGDVQCAMYGLLRDDTDAVVNISTSIQLGFSVSQDTSNFSSLSSLSFFPYFQGQKLALFAGLNGGNVLGCLAESISNWIKELGFTDSIEVSSILLKMQELANKKMLLAESANITFCPTFYGERHNTALKGHILGLDPKNMTNVGNIFHAASQGLVDHLSSMVSVDFLVERGIRQLLVTGSVPLKNPIICQRLQQLYGGKLDVVMSEQGDPGAGSAFGAALVVKRVF